MSEFKAWDKIPRWENEKFFYTEKLDGTNACVVIVPEATRAPGSVPIASVNGLALFAQSRTRMIVPGDDNFGFAGWVQKNAADLASLGEGYHYGEWWGLGIQRGYGQTEKRFSLFNTQRWNYLNPERPACCGVVPTIRAASLEEARQTLIDGGSLAVPGWMKPEGLVIFSYLTKSFYKSIIDKAA